MSETKRTEGRITVFVYGSLLSRIRDSSDFPETPLVKEVTLDARLFCDYEHAGHDGNPGHPYIPIATVADGIERKDSGNIVGEYGGKPHYPVIGELLYLTKNEFDDLTWFEQRYGFKIEAVRVRLKDGTNTTAYAYLVDFTWLPPEVVEISDGDWARHFQEFNRNGK
ncbi:MAG: gamma-glutamylcyclotransferase [Nanoarchaeota archaeon]|nr:gamma-glutamylcyclotransferase [Nanoarchaeota archaeon]MBU1004711.1 gamma-glutamylcyclotransferase [Nanoarchaeota archaeon]MBU1945757.1 gamma-glutamylcyclotransferase [Nanoarchaeota archaeon]